MGGRRPIRRATRRAALVMLCSAVTACTAAVNGTGSPQALTTTPTSAAPSTSSSPPTTSTSTSPQTSLPPAACPSTYRTPDPLRPRVALTFTVTSDLATVHGTEHIVFTPDRPINELIFRLTANTAPSVAEGNRIVVTSARADHGAGAFHFTRAGAAANTQGGLLHLPFAKTIPAQTRVTADLAFTVTLGQESFDRFGRTGSGAQRFAWFASAQPLLSWEHGYGWHAEDLIQFTAESATSEAMDTDLTVTAPATETVIMSGDPTTPAGAANGMRTWHSHLATARDVSVAVGPFSVSDTTVGTVRLRVGAYTAGVRDSLVPEFRRAILELSKRFGPFPFPSLSVARVPAQGGGIEYPAAILMLDGSRLVAVHETAHQWFYAMVGDSQSLHPWLDEAFASYAEQLVDDSASTDALSAPGTVDRSTESYGSDETDYYFVTYDKGAAALHAARAAAGSAAWDAALRCYVAANAWRIANPSDLQSAISAFPKAIAILRRAGALH